METPELFDQIATHYDRWSNLLSGEGIRAWHGFALEQMMLTPGMAVLDVGCGTGKITTAIAGRVGALGRVVGLDPSQSMLAVARRNPREKNTAAIDWVQGEAESLPFTDAQFDCVTAQFSLRNMQEWERGLEEMTRVLKPGGRVVLLEVVQPMTTLGAVAWRGLDTLTRGMRDELSAYHWLSLSVEHAPTEMELIGEMERLGLVAVKTHQWLGDLVCVCRGEKVSGRSVAVNPLYGERVIWAMDGSMTSLSAAHWMNEYLSRGTVVDIVTVIPEKLTSGDISTTDVESWQRQGYRAAKRLLPGQFIVRYMVTHGHPGEAIIKHARDYGAGLVIVGNKGRNQRADHWVGSVARYVMEHSTMPVLLFPTPTNRS